MDRRGKIQLQIRRYINSVLVKEACAGREIPLREVALAERFHTSRPTVQQACRDLIADGTLIRIPGRRGLFVNTDSPSCRGPGIDFRILCSDGKEQIFDFAAQHILEGFCRSFPDFFSDYCYAGLLSSDPDQIIQELMEIPCYAFLCIRPTPELFPVMEKLIDSGFPVVLVANYFDSHAPVPPSNAILFDYSAVGRERAKWINNNHFRRPLIYSGCTEMIRALSVQLKSHGKKLPPDSTCFFSTLGEIREKLPGIIRRYKPDCLVADGQIVSVLQASSAIMPELEKIPVYLDDFPRAIQLQKEHPELDIRLSETKYSEKMIEIGECAAEMMRRLLKESGRFKNCRTSDFSGKNKTVRI